MSPHKSGHMHDCMNLHSVQNWYTLKHSNVISHTLYTDTHANEECLGNCTVFHV